MRPFATGYSSRQMCESVPQIVVVVTRTIASVGPHAGLATSSMWMSCFPRKTAARIVSAMSSPSPLVHRGRPRPPGSVPGGGRPPLGSAHLALDLDERRDAVRDHSVHPGLDEPPHLGVVVH